MTPIKALLAGTAEILVPLIVRIGVKVRSETTGDIMLPERISIVVWTTTAQACAWSALTSTFTSIALALRYSDTHNTCAIPCDCKVTIC